MSVAPQTRGSALGTLCRMICDMYDPKGTPKNSGSQFDNCVTIPEQSQFCKFEVGMSKLQK